MAGEGSSHEKNFKYYIKNILGYYASSRAASPFSTALCETFGRSSPPLPCRITLPVSALRLPPGRKAPALRLKGA